ncbi:MAG: histidinol-phosphatase [Thiovulaceae bacterium]|nr:histidinol-phosphatase [Sulfurimonadaceae bacterium]
MRIDLHNHTYLCNHAQGTIDQYIENAIAKNIDVFGFSDHAPMHYDPKYRMSFEQMTFYEKMILDAKTNYADKIDIKLAYEVDFLPGYMDDRVLKAKVDYLIGSVHFIGDWGFDNPEFIGRYEHQDIDQIWQEYFDTIEAMAYSGYFDIVGHLDLIKVFKFLPKKDVRLLASKALKAIKKAGMSIEINGAGLRKPIGEAYPSRLLLEEAFSLDIPITFASDAHAPEQVGLFTQEIESFAKEIGFTHCALYENKERTLISF